MFSTMFAPFLYVWCFLKRIALFCITRTPLRYPYSLIKNLYVLKQTVSGSFSIYTTTETKAADKWNTIVCEEAGFKYPKHESIEDDSNEIISKLQYPFKHAVGIYPPWFLFFNQITPNIFSIFKSTRELIAHWFELEISDSKEWLIYPKESRDSSIHQRWTFLNLFFYWRGSNDVFKPPYYLMRDEKKRCYVLSIRGSVTLSDWMTDLIEAPSVNPVFCVDDGKYCVEGQVHDGMYKSAQIIYDEVIGKIREIYSKKKKYQLIVTGHSLGAGVASLIGLLFMKDAEENASILPYLQVYSFATPSIVSCEVAHMKQAQKYIHSIILNTDVVSRITPSSAKQYKRRIDTIKPDLHRSNSDLAAQARALKQLPGYNILYPAGNVHWFVPKDNENKGNLGFFHVLKSLLLGDRSNYSADDWKLIDNTEKKDIFAELLFDGYEALYAHFPQRYAWALGLSSKLQKEL